MVSATSKTTIRAKTYCELYVLTKAAFDDSVIECLDDDQAKMIRSAILRPSRSKSRMVVGQRFGRTTSSRIVGSAMYATSNGSPQAASYSASKLMSVPRRSSGLTNPISDIDTQFETSLKEEDRKREMCCQALGHSSVFLPESRFRNAWMLCCFLGVLYNVFSLSFEMAFFYDDTLFREHSATTGLAVVLTLNYLIDFFFIVDIIFSARFFAFFNNDGGDVVTSHKEIWQRAKASNFFYLDILASLPTDLIAFSIGLKYLPVLRLNRMARLCHLYEYFLAVERYFLYKMRWNVSLSECGVPLKRFCFSLSSSSGLAVCGISLRKLASLTLVRMQTGLT